MVRGRLVTRRSTTMPRTATVHAVTAIGIDMGKNTLHMVGLDTRGNIVLRKKVSRGRSTSRLANLPPCLIGIEAGMATHYVGSRACGAWPRCEAGAAAVRRRPYSARATRTMSADAFAVAEAAQRPTTRCLFQLKTNRINSDLQALHRVRSDVAARATRCRVDAASGLQVINRCRGVHSSSAASSSARKDCASVRSRH